LGTVLNGKDNKKSCTVSINDVITMQNVNYNKEIFITPVGISKINKNVKKIHPLGPSISDQ